MKKLLLLLALLLLSWQGVLAQPAPTEADTVRRETPAEFLARYPAITGAYPTRVGNSAGGTSESLPPGTPNRTFPDGAFVRLSIPMSVDRVGLEYDPNGKEFLRLHSPNNEGGWHDTLVDPLTGKVVGGMWDMPWPRTDRANKTDENGWQYGTGYWAANRHLFTDRWTKERLNDYTNNLRFVDIPKGKGAGKNGYEWDGGTFGFRLTGPKGLKLFGLVPFETVVTDPDNANLAFSRNNSFSLNWGAKGSGKEVRDFTPSYDFDRYPTDPRREYENHAGPGPLAAVRPSGKGTDLYVLMGETDTLVYKWDDKAKVLVPVAFLALSPKSFPSTIPNHPAINWGQGAIARVGKSGNFTGEWEVIPDLYGLSPAMSINPLRAVDPRNGDIYLTPSWKQRPVHPHETRIDRWKTFDIVKGIFSTDNVSSLPLPDHFKSADKCEQIRIDWPTGDLYAVVQRIRSDTSGEGEWRLERYKGWLAATDESRKTLLPVYSVGPVALTVRGDYEWWQTATGESFGTMAILGDYVFIAEAQHMGLRIHRASDGAIVGRAFDENHTNATIDNRSQIQVTQSPAEFRIFLMDFHGKSALVWRIPKKSLK